MDDEDFEIDEKTATRRARAILDRDDQFKGFYLASEIDFNKWLSKQPEMQYANDAEVG